MTYFSVLFSYYRVSLLFALLPAIILMVLIYRQDKVEREPVGLLVRLVLFGGVSVIAAGLLEGVLISVLGIFIQNQYSIIFRFIEYFIIVAVVEEGCKYIVLRSTWNETSFNYRFDAVVYGVASALGFAAAENIMYVFRLGIGVAPVRAITAIPLHCICGIFMGHYYGMSKSCERWEMTGEMTMYHLMSIIVPVLIHGFYDYAATSDSVFMEWIFVAFVVAIDLVAIRSVRKYSEQDTQV